MTSLVRRTVHRFSVRLVALTAVRQTAGPFRLSQTGSGWRCCRLVTVLCNAYSAGNLQQTTAAGTAGSRNLQQTLLRGLWKHATGIAGAARVLRPLVNA